MKRLAGKLQAWPRRLAKLQTPGSTATAALVRPRPVLATASLHLQQVTFVTSGTPWAFRYLRSAGVGAPLRGFASGRGSNLYEVLGVSPSATQAEVKKAYITEAKKCHPDLNPSKDAKDRFQKLAEAYEVLGNVERRRQPRFVLWASFYFHFAKGHVSLSFPIF